MYILFIMTKDNDAVADNDAVDVLTRKPAYCVVLMKQRTENKSRTPSPNDKYVTAKASMIFIVRALKFIYQQKYFNCSSRSTANTGEWTGGLLLSFSGFENAVIANHGYLPSNARALRDMISQLSEEEGVDAQKIRDIYGTLLAGLCFFIEGKQESNLTATIESGLQNDLQLAAWDRVAEKAITAQGEWSTIMTEVNLNSFISKCFFYLFFVILACIICRFRMLMQTIGKSTRLHIPQFRRRLPWSN